MRDSVAMIKLKIPAGSATMGGTIAPALGQKGVKAKDFVDAFNERTQHLPKGVEVFTTIYVKQDKSFTFKANTESASDRLRKIANIKSGSQTPGRAVVATITMDQVMSIAKEKITDTFAADFEKECKSIIGTARSMGIEVK